MANEVRHNIPNNKKNFTDNYYNKNRELNKLFRISWGLQVAGTYVASLELRVFDYFEDGKIEIKTLVEAVKYDATGTKALLDALVALEILTCDEKYYYLSKEMSDYLRTDSDKYIGHIWKVHKELNFPVWSRLGESIKTGKPANKLFGAEKNKVWEVVIPYLNSISKPVTEEMRRILNLDSIRNEFKVLDVGCGSGIYGQMITLNNSNATIVGIDRDNVLDFTREQAISFGVSNRTHYISGNIFEVDYGQQQYDFIILSHILHGFNDSENKKLLEKCYDALKPGGKVIINEFVVEDRNPENVFPLLFGVEAFLVGSGHAYSFNEYKNLLLYSNFSKVNLEYIVGPSNLILAEKGDIS